MRVPKSRLGVKCLFKALLEDPRNEEMLKSNPVHFLSWAANWREKQLGWYTCCRAAFACAYLPRACPAQRSCFRFFRRSVSAPSVCRAVLVSPCRAEVCLHRPLRTSHSKEVSVCLWSMFAFPFSGHNACDLERIDEPFGRSRTWRLSWPRDRRGCLSRPGTHACLNWRFSLPFCVLCVVRPNHSLGSRAFQDAFLVWPSVSLLRSDNMREVRVAFLRLRLGRVFYETIAQHVAD